MRFGFIIVAALAMCGCASMHHEKEEEEKNEVKMALADVPGPVRDGLQREAGDAQIGTVDKEERHGKTVYETDVKKDGKNWEIVVDENGNLVKKKLEKDEDEKCEKVEKCEHK